MGDESSNGRRRGPPLLVVIGFLLAFAATVLTVLLTGLLARAPDASQRAPASPAATAPAERAASAQ